MADESSDLTPLPLVVVPYQFTPAFPAEHFVSKWITHYAELCDAALEFHEAAALVALAVATPGLRARLTGTGAAGLGTNLYVLLLGDPGRSRKSTARVFATDAVDDVFKGARLPELASQEGMIEALSGVGSAALWSVDEFTDMLVKIINTQYLSGYRGMLLELYHSTTYTYKRASKKLKKDEEREPDELSMNVRLSLLACATPTLFQNLDNTAVGSGLLSRFSVVMPEGKPPRRALYELPNDIDQRTRVFRDWLAGIRRHSDTQAVVFADGVLELLDREIDAPLEASADRGLMTERIGVMARKVAMLSAAGRAWALTGVEVDRTKLVVGPEDAEAAIVVARRWLEYARAFEVRAGESAFEIKVQRCAAIVQAHRGWIHRRVVARRVHMEARVLKEVQETLLTRGLIEVREIRGETGRPGVVWRWVR